MENGVTAIVTGDHVWNQKEILPFLDECKRIVRPLNYAENLSGSGLREISLDNGQKLLLLEVVGRVFMENVETPLLAAEKALKNYTLTKNTDAILIDIHAEATAEKQAFARYFDGRVSAVIGSHTHVPTADIVVLPKGELIHILFEIIPDHHCRGKIHFAQCFTFLIGSFGKGQGTYKPCIT